MPEVTNQSFQTDAGNSFAKVHSGIEKSVPSFQQLTTFMGSLNVTQWSYERTLSPHEIENCQDLQEPWAARLTRSGTRPLGTAGSSGCHEHSTPEELH